MVDWDARLIPRERGGEWEVTCEDCGHVFESTGHWTEGMGVELLSQESCPECGSSNLEVGDPTPEPYDY